MPDIKCANCGSSFPLDKAKDFLTCSFCSSTLYIGRNAVVKHFCFSPVITEKRARSLFSEEAGRLGLGETPVLVREGRRINLDHILRGLRRVSVERITAGLIDVAEDEMVADYHVSPSG